MIFKLVLKPSNTDTDSMATNPQHSVSDPI